MGQLLTRYSPSGKRWVHLTPRTVRSRRKTKLWPEPEENRLKLSPEPTSAALGWGDDLLQCAQEQSPTVSAKNIAAIELLRSWREVDEQEKQEQKETWEFLKQALDEDRYR